MFKSIYLAILAAGVMLVILGVRASESFGSDISRLFTGNPTDKAIYLLIGGAVLCVIGLAGLMRGRFAR